MNVARLAVFAALLVAAPASAAEFISYGFGSNGSAERFSANQPGGPSFHPAVLSGGFVFDPSLATFRDGSLVFESLSAPDGRDSFALRAVLSGNSLSFYQMERAGSGSGQLELSAVFTFRDDYLRNAFPTAIDPTAITGGSVRYAANDRGGFERFTGSGLPTLSANTTNRTGPAEAFAGIRTLAVPEPSTWATMILGFAAIGQLLRRQRRQRAAATA